MECHLKWNITQNGMSLKIECHSNGRSHEMECYSQWNVTPNGMPLKMKYHSKWNVTQS